MTNDIKLTFKNQSDDTNNSEVVIFQKNIATTFNELPIAWKVIRNCAIGWKHPFIFPVAFEVSASDSWGNHLVNPLTASNGQLFHVFQSGSGNSLAYQGPATSQDEVQITNDLLEGSVNAEIYKAGKLLATKTGVSLGQKAEFKFKPTLCIGVVSQVQEGQFINSAILSDINTELGLLGIASADIVMTGGGVGPNARPFEFHLENITYV